MLRGREAGLVGVLQAATEAAMDTQVGKVAVALQQMGSRGGGRPEGTVTK